MAEAFEQPDPAPGGALPDRAADTRSRILCAAERCFVRRGFSGTRMDDIAAAAGVSRALVHRYFSSKARLLARVRVRALEQWAQAVDAATADAPDAAAELRAWLEVNLERVRVQPILQAIFGGAALAASDPWDDGVLEMRERSRARIRRMLARGLREGVFGASTDLDASVEALQEIFFGWMSQRFGALPPSSFDDARKLRATVHLLVDGLRTRDRPPDEVRHD